MAAVGKKLGNCLVWLYVVTSTAELSLPLYPQGIHEIDFQLNNSAAAGQ
jgi:hypothetical protein